MESFCGGKEFWNINLTWNEKRSWPEFTECFQNTVLVWISSGWLWLTAPIYITYLLKSPSDPLPRSWRHITQMTLAALQVVIIIVELSYGGSELRDKGETFWQAYFIGPLIEGLTLLLVFVYMELERRKGFITSGVLFIYWLLACLTFIIPFYTEIIKEGYNEFLLGFLCFNLYFAASLIQLVLSCIAERLPDTPGKQPCPEIRASFLSRMTFTWINKLVVLGFKRPITEDDMFMLNPREQSRNVIPKFERKWKAEVKKVYRSGIRARLKTDKVYVNANGGMAGCELSESTPLLQGTSAKGASAENKEKKESKEQKISLAKVLVKTYWWEFLRSNIWKLFYDALLFANPFLLQLLIEFAEDFTKPDWMGYIMASGFLAIIFLQSFCFHQLMFQSINLGLRVRSVLISAIFKKALTMNNKARTESTVGEIVNLMSVDCQHLADLSSYLWAAWSSPLQIIAALIFLYYTVGVAMFAGLGVMVVLLPFNGFITAKVGKYQKQQMAKKDERLKLMNEILNGIKILKLYAWELAFGNKVMAVRTEELRILRKQAIVNAFFTFSWTVAPFTVGLATFAVYIFTKDDHRIDAQTAFVAITLFNILRFAVLVAPIMVMELVKTFVSIKRIGKYLNHEDLDQSMVMHSSSDVAISINRGTFGWDSQIGPCLRDINLRVPKGSLIAVVGSVGSGKSSLVSATLGEMEKLGGQVNVDGSIAYVPQQAWIQNMTVRDNILFGNPMNASKYEKIIEACALQSDLDILPAKDMTEIGEKGINLSGGQKQRVSLARAVYFDADIYLLDDPLSAVDAHVGKHIFEKLIGSEGLLKNKTRVLVTHGIHWLPSVDVIVVMDNGKISEVGSYEQLMAHDGAFAQFLRTYLVNTESDEESDDEDQEIKTTILKRLVSIQSDISDDIKEVIKRQQSKTSESKSGTHSESDQGHHSVKPKSRTRSESEQKSDSESTYKLLKRQLSRPEHSDAEHSDHLKLMRRLSYKSGSDTEHSPSKGDKVKSSKSVDIARQTSKVDTVLETDPSAQLIEEEELEIGRVRWGVLIAYGRAVGLPFVLIIFLLYGAYQGFSVWANIWLTDWTSDSDLQNLTAYPGDSQDRRDKNDYYLTIYGVLGIAQAVMVVCYSVTALVRMIRATGVLHEKMLRNILRGPMSFFDTTPIGRIVNRFSQDIESIDLKIPQSVESFLDCLFVVISTLVIIVYSTPIFASIIVPLMLVYLAIQRFYIPTSRQLKRLESKARSPIYNHFSETLTGASIIRAYGVQKRFALESEKRVDHNQTYYFSSVTVNRWLGFRLEILGGFVVGIAAIFAVLERSNISGSLVGLSISYALQITDNLNWLVRMVSELETNIVSVERVQQYTVTPVEAPLKTNRRPPHFWPEHGVVKLENYCVRYREGLDLVLKGITIHINSGEKIGIVGRTGAGKSSLTLSLFRLIEPAGGKIIIDGEDITKLGLYDLRAKLTILPQEPVLFSGTLRMNLDPLFEYSDNELWRVLEHAHLKSYVESLPTGLEYECGEGGQNLSVGQRQLMCLARSLLRKSKILILDEATAAVDMETDELIQKTINTEFQDCTVLTIAHRLNTVIDYDRILVLDKGVVKEFDKPDTLLTNTDSIFYGMAKDAGLVS